MLLANYRELPVETCVYKLTHRDSSRIYIGRTSDLKNRMRRHFQDLNNGKHKNPKMQHAHNKYGEHWGFEVIARCSIEDSIDLEELLLEELDIKSNFNCHSNSIGGSKNQVWTVEQRENHSRVLSGKKRTKEQNAKQSIALSNSQAVKDNCNAQQPFATKCAATKEIRAKAVATRRASSNGVFFSDATRKLQTDKARAKVFSMLEWAIENSKTRADAILEFGSSWGSLKLYLPDWEAINGKLPIFNKHSKTLTT